MTVMFWPQCGQNVIGRSTGSAPPQYRQPLPTAEGVTALGTDKLFSLDLFELLIRVGAHPVAIVVLKMLDGTLDDGFVMLSPVLKPELIADADGNDEDQEVAHDDWG